MLIPLRSKINVNYRFDDWVHTAKRTHRLAVVEQTS